MPRHPYRPLVLLAGALVLPLCLGRPVLADPSTELSIGAGAADPVSAHAAEIRSQRDLVATARNGFTAGFDDGDFDVERFEASLPRNMPHPSGEDAAAATVTSVNSQETTSPLESAAELDVPDFDVALFEVGLPRDMPVPPERDPAASSPATANADECKLPLQSAAEPVTADFDVALFEAALPRDEPAPEAATLAVAAAHASKPPLTSAVEHPRHKTPAAKRPLRSAAARGKTTEPARTARPAARNVAAAAPPATIAHARPRTAKPYHGPRELFIARVPSDERDEMMPAQRATPVMRMSLPPPTLALK
jgi:hypothetical protein